MTHHGLQGPVDSILETIGNTPLVRLGRIAPKNGAEVLAKLESFNPGGSVKDRVAVALVNLAEENGDLKPGGTIVESTSGNTGMGLALCGVVRGYRVILTMPDKVSTEKRLMLQAMGAEVVITPTEVSADDPRSYYSVAKKIADETPNSLLANQYFNPENPAAHYRSTGPEIWEQTGGAIDAFVAGVGTGGTISGVARYLKEQNPNVRIIGADPVGSILKHYHETGEMAEPHQYLTEGIGEDIIPANVHFELIDEFRTVTDKDAFRITRSLGREEGLLVGGSCGAAVWVAFEVAKEFDPGKTVVVLLPDTGERYLSKVHNEEWLKSHGMLDS